MTGVETCALPICSLIGVVHSIRERFYADHGAAYLGSTHDDGCSSHEFSDFHFTYPDIAVTLYRLTRLARWQHWRLSCVVPLDRLTEPLARALAMLLEIPVRRPEDLRADDVALLVLAVGHQAELLKLALERAPCLAVTFCLGLNWLRHSAVVPDLIGVAARDTCSIPWEPEFRRLRAHGTPADQLDHCLNQAFHHLVAVMQTLSPEAINVQNLTFFQNFRRLRYLERASGASAVS